MSAWPSKVGVRDDAFPLIHLTMAFESSPVFDPPGKEGLSCLTNRLMCRGTHALRHAELSEAIEALGTELITSTQRNAVTVGGTVLARHIEDYLALLGDVFTQPRFDPNELEKVRREIISEHGLLLDDDNQLARHWLRAGVFGGTKPANAAIGKVSSVVDLSMDDVTAWHSENYVQRRLSIGTSGPIESDIFLENLDGLISRIPVGETRQWPTRTRTPKQGRRVILVDKPSRAQSQILVGHSIGITNETDLFRLKLATSSFGGTFTSRLMQEIRVKRGLSYGAYAWVNQDRCSGLYLLGASTDSERMGETLEILLGEFELFANRGLSNDELHFARTHLLNGFPFTIETAAQEAANRLRTRLLGLPTGHLERWHSFLAETDIDEVNQVVRAHLRPADCNVVIVCTVSPDLIKQVNALAGVTDVQTVSHKHHLDL